MYVHVPGECVIAGGTRDAMHDYGGQLLAASE